MMQRVMRLRTSYLAEQWEDAFAQLPAFIDSLALPIEVRNMIALPESDGEYTNFYIDLPGPEGGSEQVPIHMANPVFPQNRLQAQFNFEKKRDFIVNAIEPILAKEEEMDNESPIPPSPALMLKVLLSHPQYLQIVNETEPVLIPFFTRDHLERSMQVAQAASAPQKSTSTVRLILGLVALITLSVLIKYFFKI